jgi:hypothetical protein
MESRLHPVYHYRIMPTHRIMRVPVFALVLAAALTILPPGAAADTPSEYATLLASLKAGNTNIDYARLRFSYMDSPEYKQAKDTTDSENAMLDALNAKDYPSALKSAEEVLASEYVNIDAHFVAYLASKQMGAADKAEFHHAVFKGLVDSILNSGDGLSPKTAWVVISVHEEYFILHVLGMRPSSQSVLQSDGHSYDKMTVKDENGVEHIFYFNVDIPFKHYGF